MSTENVDKISADQCRGARVLLDMTQPELASASGLGLSTVVDFEKSRRPVSGDAIRAMRKALETIWHRIHRRKWRWTGRAPSQAAAAKKSKVIQ